jgi:hypothetical protein
MSISTAARKAGPFIGNDAATAFAFAFKVFGSADLLVMQADIASGVETALTLDSDYTVTLNGDQDNNPGGTVTLLTGALPLGQKLVITTSIAELQAVAVTNQDGFNPDLLNDALDLVTMLVQQLREVAERSLTFPITGAPSSAMLPGPAERAGKMLMFDGDGNPLLMAIAPGGTVPGAQAAAGIVDGANRDFTFVAAAGATPAPIVFVGGIFQTPGDDYAAPAFVSGITWKISFTSAPIAVDPANPPRVRVLLLA